MKKFLAIIIGIITCLTSCFMFACNEQIECVSIKYYADGSEILAGLKSGAEEIGMLPEPAATMLEKQTPDTTWYRLDVQELYDGQAKAYPQAVLMVKSSLLKAHPEIVTDIQSKIDINVAWAKQNAGIAVSAIQSVFPATTLKAPMLSEKSIDGCKIYFQSAVDAKASVNKYISDIREMDETSAKVVGDEFYYTPENASGTWDKDITFCAPDGAPSIAIAKFINDNESFGTGKTINYSVVKADTIVAKMATASADIILMPINGATKKYNDGGNATDPYKLVSVITHGNFYIMSKTQMEFKDLANKRIAVPNMNAVPDWTFKCILKNNNLCGIVVD